MRKPTNYERVVCPDDPFRDDLIPDGVWLGAKLPDGTVPTYGMIPAYHKHRKG